MTRVKTCVAAGLLLAFGCTSSATRPAGIEPPEIYLVPPPMIFFGSSPTAPVTVDIQVTNRANVPLILRDIEISSSGMVEYEVIPTRRIFNQTIEPQATGTFTIFATGERRTGMMPSEPLSLRAIVTLEASGARFREFVHLR